MNLVLNLLKALGIVIGWYLLLVAGIMGMLAVRFGGRWYRDIGLKDIPTSAAALVGAVLLYGVLPFILALGALYLTPRGQLFAAMGALALIAAIWVYCGIHIFGVP